MFLQTNVDFIDVFDDGKKTPIQRILFPFLKSEQYRFFVVHKIKSVSFTLDFFEKIWNSEHFELFLGNDRIGKITSYAYGNIQFQKDTKQKQKKIWKNRRRCFCLNERVRLEFS